MGDDFPLTLSREEWGIIIDGLGLEIDRSFLRKQTNAESASDIRVDMCEKLIKMIMAESNRW